MKQTSPESIDIFDLILELYAACSGNWQLLAQEIGVSDQEIDKFLDYAATFLSNLGNYHVREQIRIGSVKLTGTGLW